MDSLNRFMSSHNMPGAMRVRLREYFHQTRHMQRGQRRRQLLMLMSPSLRGEVCEHINRPQLEAMRFLKEVTLCLGPGLL